MKITNQPWLTCFSTKKDAIWKYFFDEKNTMSKTQSSQLIGKSILYLLCSETLTLLMFINL